MKRSSKPPPSPSPKKQFNKKSSFTSSSTSPTPKKSTKICRRRRTIDSNNDVLPQFLDADYTLSAAKFSARRLPETISLWRTFVEHQHHHHHHQQRQTTDASGSSRSQYGDDAWYYRGGGCQASKRHLRRRTVSHNRRKRHRFPEGGGGNVIAVPAAVCNKGDDVVGDDDSKASSKMNRKSRKARRKPALLRILHSSWHNPDNTQSLSHNPDNTQLSSLIFSSSSPSASVSSSEAASIAASNWLETHLWHAKRFYMTPPFLLQPHPIIDTSEQQKQRWCIPLGHTNRGSSAALRLTRTKSTIQDATWTIGGTILKLEVTTDMVDGVEDDEGYIGEFPLEPLSKSILSRLCGGSGSSFWNRREFWNGVEMGEGVIHRLDIGFPGGAIGPASFHVEQPPLRTNGNHEYYTSLSVSIRVPQSIANDVASVLRQLVDDSNKLVDGSDTINNRKCHCDVSFGSMSLIRVRGMEATAAINRSLRLRSLSNTNKMMTCGGGGSEGGGYDWDVIRRCKDAHSMLPHGSIVPVFLDGFVTPIHSTNGSISGSGSGSGAINGTTTEDKSQKQYGDDTSDELISIRDHVTNVHNGQVSSMWKIDTTPTNDQYVRSGTIVYLISQCPNPPTSNNEDDNDENENKNTNPTSSPQNIGINGWDILCPPQHQEYEDVFPPSSSPQNTTSLIFSNIIHHGGACAIGLIEQARLQSEADPPRPVWPRDYPDTDCGRRYWKEECSVDGEGGGGNSEEGEGDWNLLRFCVEEGTACGGRIKTGLKRVRNGCHVVTSLVLPEGKDGSDGDDDGDSVTRMNLSSPTVEMEKQKSDGIVSQKIKPYTKDTFDPQPIQWSALTTSGILQVQPDIIVDDDDDDDATTETNPPSSNAQAIVVRGAFLQPFRQALSGWRYESYNPDGEVNTNTKPRRRRRPRRRVRAPYESINLPPLSIERAEAQRSMCQTFASSLSLPALVPCHLMVEGRGTFRAASPIFEYGAKFCKSSSSLSVRDDEVGEGNEGEEIEPRCLLGYVASGGFSPSRGRFHGVGFVGCRRFLEHLAKVRRSGCVAIQDSVLSSGDGESINAGSKVAIRVLIGGTSQLTPIVASLTLLMWNN